MPNELKKIFFWITNYLLTKKHLNKLGIKAGRILFFPIINTMKRGMQITGKAQRAVHSSGQQMYDLSTFEEFDDYFSCLIKKQETRLETQSI